MDKKLIWVGLGAVALYLYFRNKPTASAVTQKIDPNQPTPIITPNAPRPRPKNVPVLIPDKGEDFYDPYMKWSCEQVKDMFEKEKQKRYIQDPCRANPKDCFLKNIAYKRCGLR